MGFAKFTDKHSSDYPPKCVFTLYSKTFARLAVRVAEWYGIYDVQNSWDETVWDKKKSQFKDIKDKQMGRLNATLHFASSDHSFLFIKQ